MSDPREEALATNASPKTPDVAEADAVQPPPSRWRLALRWGERLLWVAVLGFVLVRLGPQFGALLGVGPTLGSAPEVAFTTLDGDAVTPEDLAGRVVVLNFWATWCPPCRLEIPALQALHEELGSEGVLVLGLSTDATGSAGVREFLDERGVSYPVGMATALHRRDFGGVSALPTTFILDRNGVIRHRVFGFFAPPAMRAAVRRLLEEPAPTGD